MGIENPNKMNVLKGIVTLFMLFFLFSISIGQISNDKEVVNGKSCFVHTVKQGETLYSLAKLYGVSEKDITAFNSGADVVIKIGQKLFIPDKNALTADVTNKPPINTQPKKESFEYISYKVQKGETLYSIARRYNSKVEWIVSENPGSENGISTGEILSIPVLSENPPQPITKEPEPPKNKEPEKEIATREVKTEFPDSKLKNSITKSDCETNAVLKAEYKIALLLPFGTSEDVGAKSSSVAYQFYAGALLASDMYKLKTANVQITVFNTGNAENNYEVDQILKNPDLKKSDLIIGPLYSSIFKKVADFAESNNIPIVSPFSRLNTIIEKHPYVHKLTPTAETFYNSIADYITNRIRPQNLILYHSGLGADSVFIKIVTQRLKENLKTDNLAQKNVFIASNTSEIATLLKSETENYVYYPCSKEITVNAFMTAMRSNTKNNNLTVIGDESWLQFKNFDIEYYNKTKLQIPVMNYGNYLDSTMAHFVSRFRADFRTEPDQYAFKAYDIVCYYATMLEKYGNLLAPCAAYTPMNFPSTSFKLQSIGSNSGYENKGITILKLNEYEIQVTTY
jgi:LysM repeat protein